MIVSMSNTTAPGSGDDSFLQRVIKRNCSICSSFEANSILRSFNFFSNRAKHTFASAIRASASLYFSMSDLSSIFLNVFFLRNTKKYQNRRKFLRKFSFINICANDISKMNDPNITPETKYTEIYIESGNEKEEENENSQRSVKRKLFFPSPFVSKNKKKVRWID